MAEKRKCVVVGRLNGIAFGHQVYFPRKPFNNILHPQIYNNLLDKICHGL